MDRNDKASVHSSSWGLLPRQFHKIISSQANRQNTACIQSIIEQQNMKALLVVPVLLPLLFMLLRILSFPYTFFDSAEAFLHIFA